MDNKAPDAFRTISEVADELDLPQHVLRFWESRFRDIKPMKRGGGRRYYRPEDIDLLRGIRHLLYGEGYTIRGVQRILREQSVGFVQAVWQEGAPQPPHGGETAGSDDEDIADAAVDDEGDADAVEESRGLRGRLSNLIGRDLGDRGEFNDGRRDPPLQSAPMPRVDPGDRVIGAVDFGEQEPPRTATSPAPFQSPLKSPIPQPTQSAAASAVDIARVNSAANMARLREALYELAECRKLIDGAMVRDDDMPVR